MSPLFDLIALAGNASLSELRARSPGDSATLADELVGFLRAGTVKIHPSKSNISQIEENPVYKNMMDLIEHQNAKPGYSSTTDKDPVEVVRDALENQPIADSLNVSATSRGFRLGL